MSKYFKNSNIFRVAPDGALDIYETLPKGTYILKYNEDKDEYYLEISSEFNIPKKLYGETEKRCNRIINTFLNRETNTGVLLVGEKGSGKTLLSKLVSFKLNEQNIPTIICNTAYSGDTFNKFISDIKQPVCFIFDEFEKVFSKDDGCQEKLLTLFDGVFDNKKLFIFTSNNKYRIDECLVNRPGRIYYYFEYSNLDTNFIREYCMDNLINKDEMDSIFIISKTFESFNFDMLKALVEEMNRYSESAIDSVACLNMKHDFDSKRSLYNVTSVKLNGIEIPDNSYDKKVKLTPLNAECEWYFDIDVSSFDKSKFKLDSSDIIELMLTPKNIIKYDSDIVVYKMYTSSKNTDGLGKENEIVVTVKKEENTVFNPFKLLV